MSRQSLIISGSVLLIILLAGAAFVGGQFLMKHGPAFTLLTSNAGTGKAHQGLYLNMIPAAELPTTSPAVTGTFIRRMDNSLFIGNDSKQVQVQSASQGGSVTLPTGSSSEMEVVVTQNTKIYRDVTSKQFKTPPKNGQVVQQVLEPGQTDAIEAGSTVQVWGWRNGGRIIADVLLYSNPAYIPEGVPKP